MAIEIQLERMHVVEAMTARDAVVQRLADAYVSINQKNAIIDDLKRNRGLCDSETKALSTVNPIQDEEKPAKDVPKLEDLHENPSNGINPLGDAPPSYEEGELCSVKVPS